MSDEDHVSATSEEGEEAEDVSVDDGGSFVVPETPEEEQPLLSQPRRLRSRLRGHNDEDLDAARDEILQRFTRKLERNYRRMTKHVEKLARLRRTSSSVIRCLALADTSYDVHIVTETWPGFCPEHRAELRRLFHVVRMPENAIVAVPRDALTGAERRRRRHSEQRLLDHGLGNSDTQEEIPDNDAESDSTVPASAQEIAAAAMRDRIPVSTVVPVSANRV